MRTRRISIGLGILAIAGAAVAVSARSVAAPVVPAQEVSPGPNQIIVVLTCTGGSPPAAGTRGAPPPQVGDNAPQGGGIRVNPYRRNLDSNESATWRSVGNFDGEYTIEPVGFFPWTLSNGGTSNADGEVVGTPPAAGAPDGVFDYKVRFTCNGDEVVLDPRMEVPR